MDADAHRDPAADQTVDDARKMFNKKTTRKSERFLGQFTLVILCRARPRRSALVAGLAHSLRAMRVFMLNNTDGHP